MNKKSSIKNKKQNCYNRSSTYSYFEPFISCIYATYTAFSAIKKNGSVSSIYSTKLGEDPNIINCSNTTPEKILEILETNEYINGG